MTLKFIRPGKPTDKGHIASFNGKLRDECLNLNFFYTMEDTRHILGDWRKLYNEIRPHHAWGT